MKTSSTTPPRDPVGTLVPAWTPVAGLPRARALSEALLAAGARTGSVPPDVAAVTGARERLERGLAAAVAGAGDAAAPASLLRIGHYQVARVLGGLGVPGRPCDQRGALDHAPEAHVFRWTSRAARRSVGLAALRAGLDGRAPTPADAVALVMSDPGGPFGVGRAGPGSCADWIASLAPAARSFVAAEATAWTTRLWTGVEWDRLGPQGPQGPLVGGPDLWWRWTGSAAGGGDGTRCEVAVRGRADVRVDPGPASGGTRRGAHLVVLDGQPGVATRHALLLTALVAALSIRRSKQPVSVPARVVGWWPDCGKAWVVPVDGRALALAAEAVVRTAAATLGEDAPGGRAGGN